MRRGWAMALLGAALLAGCNGSNPNVLAPKLVIDARPGGGAALFVHSAFGERAYDRLAVRLDNASFAEENGTFSLERVVPMEGFFVEAIGEVSQESYEVSARVDFRPDREHATVLSRNAEGKWSDPHEVNLPYERILERRQSP